MLSIWKIYVILISYQRGDHYDPSRKVKKLRDKSNMTQRELVEKTNLPVRSIINYENGLREPNAKALVALEEIFRVSGAYLLGYTDQKNNFDYNLNEKIQNLVDRYSELDERGRATVLRCIEEQYRLSNHYIEPEKPHTLWLRISEQSASAGTGIYLGPDAFSEIEVLENELASQADFAVPISGDSMEPKFHDGDVVLVRAEPAEIGDIAVVLLQGEGYIKQLGKRALISLNSAYDPIPCDDSFRVCGKVIGVLDPDWIQP